MLSLGSEIKLSEEDQDLALWTALKRFEFHSKRNTKQTFNHKGRSIDMEVESLGAEVAVARVLGLDWQDRSIEEDRDGDVGKGIQVRSTKHENGGLLIYHSDNGNHDFFLVTGNFPFYNVKGWINCDEGRKVGEIRQLRPDRPAVTRVDQKDLISVEGYQNENQKIRT
jgi:hypothetical protein